MPKLPPNLKTPKRNLAVAAAVDVGAAVAAAV